MRSIEIAHGVLSATLSARRIEQMAARGVCRHVQRLAHSGVELGRDQCPQLVAPRPLEDQHGFPAQVLERKHADRQGQIFLRCQKVF